MPITLVFCNGVVVVNGKTVLLVVEESRLRGGLVESSSQRRHQEVNVAGCREDRCQ
jgi:hypothetical protein